MFDLLLTCALLREQVKTGKVGFGINHEMRDFKQDRKKNLDLVVCRQAEQKTRTFAEYGQECGIIMVEEEQAAFESLPPLFEADVSNVLVALEAKACMTEHVKALPRLYDELASSHQCIHGDTTSAIAAGFAMVNCSDSFVSPDRNRQDLAAVPRTVNTHKQPHALDRTLEALMKLPRRSDESGHGFDAFGITMIRCENNGGPVEIECDANNKVRDIVKYDSLVRRIAHLYSTKFVGL